MNRIYLHKEEFKRACELNDIHINKNQKPLNSITIIDDISGEKTTINKTDIEASIQNQIEEGLKQACATGGRYYDINSMEIIPKKSTDKVEERALRIAKHIINEISQNGQIKTSSPKEVTRVIKKHIKNVKIKA
jgi:hypothetical protein